MVARRMVMGVLVMVMVLLALSVAVPSQAAQKAAGGADDKTMWCNLPNEQFYQLCMDKQFWAGLTPAQKKAVDKEWQRRVPNMSPAEKEKYYPEGRRYYSGG